MITLLARLTGFSPLVIEAFLIGLVLLAFAAVGLRIYDAGYQSAEAKCQAEELRSQLLAMKQDRDNARRALADEKLRLADIERERQDNEQRTLDYIKELEARPVPQSCALDDNDLRGMHAQPGKADGRKGASPADRSDAPRAGPINKSR